jgi:hypothetical protein
MIIVATTHRIICTVTVIITQEIACFSPFRACTIGVTPNHGAGTTLEENAREASAGAADRQRSGRMRGNVHA